MSLLFIRFQKRKYALLHLISLIFDITLIKSGIALSCVYCKSLVVVFLAWFPKHRNHFSELPLSFKALPNWGPTFLHSLVFLPRSSLILNILWHMLDLGLSYYCSIIALYTVFRMADSACFSSN